MQSTKDETGWGHRVGGAFARLHHSKRLIQNNNVNDEDFIEDLPGSLSFASRKYPREEDNFDNVAYNMQFLRHDASLVSQRKWMDNADWDDEGGYQRHSAQDDVRSSPVSSFW